MATINMPATERRHIPDRRTHHAGKSESGHRMKALEWIPMLLLIIGGINWGLVGLFDLDVVARLLGEGTPLARAVYVLVGLSALYSIYLSSRMSSRHT